MDERYRQYAHLIVNQSLQVKPGESVLISIDPISVLFGEIVAQEVICAGGNPMFWFQSPRVGATRMLEGNQQQLGFVHPAEHAMAKCHCWLSLSAPNDWHLPKFDPERVVFRRKKMAGFSKKIRRLRWTLALVPTAYLADRLGVSFAQGEDLILGAIVDVDWHEMAARARAVGALFRGGAEVRIVAEGTDLHFNIADRPWEACFGERNLPDGEAFTAPWHESVEGDIYFPDTQITHGGKAVSGLRLTFRQGKVISAKATDGHEVLQSMLDTDEGARYLGEFGIGVNPLIQRQTGNTLLDEKIAGTIHLALGYAYPETGGTNKSLLHWDLILDLRKGGRVYLDERLVCDDGKWQTLESGVRRE